MSYSKKNEDDKKAAPYAPETVTRQLGVGNSFNKPEVLMAKAVSGIHRWSINVRSLALILKQESVIVQNL